MKLWGKKGADVESHGLFAIYSIIISSLSHFQTSVLKQVSHILFCNILNKTITGRRIESEGDWDPREEDIDVESHGPFPIWPIAFLPFVSLEPSRLHRYFISLSCYIFLIKLRRIECSAEGMQPDGKISMLLQDIHVSSNVPFPVLSLFLLFM